MNHNKADTIILSAILDELVTQRHLMMELIKIITYTSPATSASYSSLNSAEKLSVEASIRVNETAIDLKEHSKN